MMMLLFIYWYLYDTAKFIESNVRLHFTCYEMVRYKVTQASHLAENSKALYIQSNSYSL